MISQRSKFFLVWLILALVFSVSSFSAVFWAQGYRLNTQTWRIQKTGILIIRTDPKDAYVFLNGHQIKQKTPVRLSFVLPRTYEIEVVKEGFISWHKTVQLEENQAISFRSIILFRSQPDSVSASDNDLKAILNQPPSVDVGIIDTELWYKTKLVSRFSTPIIQASLMPDANHIIYQRDNEIRVIELDGGNDTVLIKVQSDDKIPLAVVEDGRGLVVNDGELKKYIIR